MGTFTIETLHTDMIHDAQFDFSGKRVATCSSDCTVRVYQVNAATDNQASSQRLIAVLDGHDGPVWQICWAHPKHGSLLASCSYDKKVIVWKENDQFSSSNGMQVSSSINAPPVHTSTWVKYNEFTHHTSSVNSVIWAPQELGLILACCSSDGSASVITYTRDEQFDVVRIPDCHKGGSNAISWAPAINPVALIVGSHLPTSEIYQKKFVTGGCDNKVRVWTFDNDKNQWVQDGATLDKHVDWIRDVAWAPSTALPLSTIASCSQDGRVIIWRQNFSGESARSDGFIPQELHLFPDVVWHVSWSFTGNILAVSGGDNEVSLWKETVDSKWEKISDVNRNSKSD